MGEALQANQSPRRIGNQNPMRVPANAYAAKDGIYIAVIVQNDNHWLPFCKALGCLQWFDNPDYSNMAARAARRDDLDELVRRRFLERTAADWLPDLEKNRVPYAVVNDYQGALADPQIAFRGIVREVDHPISGRIRVIGPPWILSDVDVMLKPPPLLAQHTEEVLRDWLGISNGKPTP